MKVSFLSTDRNKALRYMADAVLTGRESCISCSAPATLIATWRVGAKWQAYALCMQCASHSTEERERLLRAAIVLRRDAA
jgi:hypothetical protein